MSFRNTIIVLILLIAVGGYALIVGLGSKPVATPKLVNADSKDITRIGLRYSDRELVLERGKDGQWRIVQPAELKADQSAVNSLAESIVNGQITKTIEEKPADLAPFGLDKPQVVATVTVKGKGALPAVEVGKRTPLGSSAYVKIADKPAVMLTSGAYPSEITKTVNDLRDRELLNFKVDQVRQFKLDHRGQPQIELVRNGDKWQIIKPAGYAADPTVVQSTLSALAELRVADFVAENPPSLAPYGLDKPQLTVTIHSGKQGQEHTIKFGASEAGGKDGIYVAVAGKPSVLTVYKESVSGFDKTVGQLRDKTVYNFDPATIGRIEASTPMEEYTLARTKNGWSISFNGKTGKADTIKVENFLDQMRFLKGAAIAADPMTDPKPFGMDHPRVSFILFDRKGKQVGELKLSDVMRAGQPGPKPNSPPVNSLVNFAASTAGPAVYGIDNYDYSQLNKTAYDLGFSAAPAAQPSPGN